MINKMKNSRGYVTVLFTIVSIIIVGVISYHIYISSNVDEIIDLQNSADISMYTLTSYSARGLNLISANNVAIASSLHIATSIPMLATFLSFGAAASNGVGYDYQENIWDRLKPIPRNYMRVSSGLSKMNMYIENEWLKVAFRQARAYLEENNKKSKAVLSLDENYKEEEKEVNKSKDMWGFFDKIVYNKKHILNRIQQGLNDIKEKGSFILDSNIKYKGLYHGGASESVCFILKGSKRKIKSKRDDMLFWLSGIVPSKSLSNVTDSLASVGHAIKIFSPVDIGYGNCGLNLKVFGKSFNNGIDYEKEFSYFEKDNNPIGVTVIDNMEEFKKGLRYKGKFWKETKYGIMGDKDREDGEERNIIVESIGEVNNRIEDREAGLFYPEWYPVLRESME